MFGLPDDGRIKEDIDCFECGEIGDGFVDCYRHGRAVLDN
jgi:hypothetical protein